MKNKKILLVLLTVVVIAVTAIALAGCNDRPEKVFAGTAADLNGFTSAKQIYPDASSISAIGGTDLLFVTAAGCCSLLPPGITAAISTRCIISLQTMKLCNLPRVAPIINQWIAAQ